MADPTTLSLEDGARVVGHHVWLEMRLFEVLGGWVPSTPEPEVKTHLATHSRRHAWHAELWHGHLPRVVGIDADALIAPPSEDAEKAVAAVAETGSGAGTGADGGPTVERLVGLYRVVLPRVVTATARRVEVASPVAEAALARSLRFVLADDLDEWREGEALVQSLLTTPDEIDRAAGHQAHLEGLVVAAGGLTPRLPPPLAD